MEKNEQGKTAPVAVSHPQLAHIVLVFTVSALPRSVQMKFPERTAIVLSFAHSRGSKANVLLLPRDSCLTPTHRETYLWYRYLDMDHALARLDSTPAFLHVSRPFRHMQARLPGCQNVMTRVSMYQINKRHS